MKFKIGDRIKATPKFFMDHPGRFNAIRGKVGIVVGRPGYFVQVNFKDNGSGKRRLVFERNSGHLRKIND